MANIRWNRYSISRWTHINIRGSMDGVGDDDGLGAGGVDVEGAGDRDGDGDGVGGQ
jgi:hypothetical protein